MEKISRTATGLEISEEMWHRLLRPTRHGHCDSWNGRAWQLSSDTATGESRIVALDDTETYLTLGNFTPSSSLYGYGGPTWCAVSPDLAIAVCDVTSVIIGFSPAGNEMFRFQLPGALSWGWPQAISPDDVLLIADFGECHREIVSLNFSTGIFRTKYRSSSLLGDLTVNPARTAAWIEWDASTMPWEGAKLVECRVDDEIFNPADRHNVPNSPVAQPIWRGESLLCSVESGEWFSLRSISKVSTIAAPDVIGEFRPDWYLGWKWIVPCDNGVLAACALESRVNYFWWSDTGELSSVPGGPPSLSYLVSTTRGAIAVGSNSQCERIIREFDAVSMSWRTISGREVDPDAAVKRTSEGVPFVLHPATRVVKPRSRRKLRGLIVTLHGGPTGYAGFGYSTTTEILCASGFDLANVDYRGSASYGRSFRRSLNGHWGVFDAEDVAQVVESARRSGRYDNERIFLRGSSAGGLTALMASQMCEVAGVVSHYGVTDLSALFRTTHEFERAYTEVLAGPPEGWQSRSPLSSVPHLTCRALMTHGDADRVVPIELSRSYVQLLQANGSDVTYLEISGAGHGYREPSDLRRVLQAEIDFYSQPTSSQEPRG